MLSSVTLLLSAYCKKMSFVPIFLVEDVKKAKNDTDRYKNSTSAPTR